MHFNQIAHEYTVKGYQYDCIDSKRKEAKEILLNKFKEAFNLTSDNFYNGDRCLIYQNDHYNFRGLHVFTFNLQTDLSPINKSSRYKLQVIFTCNNNVESYDLFFNLDDRANIDISVLRLLNTIFDKSMSNYFLPEMQEVCALEAQLNKYERQLSAYNGKSSKFLHVDLSFPSINVDDVFKIQAFEYCRHETRDIVPNKLWSYNSKKFFSTIVIPKRRDKSNTYFYRHDEGYLMIYRFYRKSVIVFYKGNRRLINILRNQDFDYNQKVELPESYKGYTTLEVPLEKFKSLLQSSVEISNEKEYLVQSNNLYIEKLDSPISRKFFTNSFDIFSSEATIYKYGYINNVYLDSSRSNNATSDTNFNIVYRELASNLKLENVEKLI